MVSGCVWVRVRLWPALAELSHLSPPCFLGRAPKPKVATPELRPEGSHELRKQSHWEGEKVSKSEPPGCFFFFALQTLNSAAGRFQKTCKATKGCWMGGGVEVWVSELMTGRVASSPPPPKKRSLSTFSLAILPSFVDVF